MSPRHLGSSYPLLWFDDRYECRYVMKNDRRTAVSERQLIMLCDLMVKWRARKQSLKYRHLFGASLEYYESIFHIQTMSSLA